MTPREERLAHFLEGFISAAEAALRARETKGGQHVPFHGDFSNLFPSTARELRWWMEAAKEALGTPSVGRDRTNQEETR